MANEFIARKGLISQGNSQITGSLDISSTLSIPGISDVSASLAAAVAGGGISAVVDDTTPQLGGDLDTNGKNIAFGDNDSASFGAAGDLLIFHDGSDSFIKDNGTGDLRIQASSTRIEDYDGSPTHIQISNSQLTLNAGNNLISVGTNKIGNGTDEEYIQFSTTDIDFHVSDTRRLRVGDGFIDVNGNITASGNISASGTLSISGFPDVSASLAAATAGGGTITGVTAGDGLTGGGSAGSVTLNVVGGTGVTANANDIAIGQDVATTANVQFANITSSGNISASGTITGNSIVGTLATAAQTNITSVGTLTALTVDQINLDGNNISSTQDTDVFVSLGTAGFDFEANTGDKFVFNTSNQNNVDFQVSGENDTDLIYADASTDRVGIGTSTPGAKLTVEGNISSSGNITASAFLTSTGQIGKLDRSITLTGGNSFLSTRPTIAGGNSSHIDFTTGINLTTEKKISFDSDTTNTYIAANNESPEDLEIHADQDIILNPDGQVIANSNISASGNITASAFKGDGSGLNNVSATLPSGVVSSSAQIADVTLTTAAQTNITSLGSLTALDVNGNADIDGTLTVGTGPNTGFDVTFISDTTNGASWTYDASADKERLVGDSEITGSLKINPASATANEVLFEISVGGTQKVFIDEDGDAGFDGSVSCNTLSVSSDGVQSAPAIIFGTDINTGIWQPADNQIALQANGGTTELTISTSGVEVTNGSLIAPKIKLSKTTATDGNHDGDVVFFGGTTSMSTGKIYYYNASGGWTIANADALADSKGLLAVALGTASDTNGMLIKGMVTLDHSPGAVADVLYLSTTDGEASSTAPSSDGHVVRILGYCLDASDGQIYFNPSNDFIVITA